MALPVPSPIHLLRSHSSAVCTLFISNDNERLYSGDSTGQIIITSTRSLRPLASWKPHTDALLGVEEWGSQIITHARDNKLHVWARPEESASIRQEPATLSGLSVPTMCYSMDVNALNYCRFFLLAEATEQEGLLAVPNLVESALVDIWLLPSRQRLHAAIGDPLDTSKTPFSDGRSGSKTGIIMAIHLFYAASSTASSSTSTRELRLLCAYEDGGVVLRKRTASENTKTIEGLGWEVLWKSKLHVESVMAMAVSADCTFALTVSADHLVGRYDLSAGEGVSGSASIGTTFKTKHPGNGAIAIRGDGRVCAVGGWDGRVRLYSTKTFKLLGTLVHHKQGCRAVMFASLVDPHFHKNTDEDNSSDDEDEMTIEEKCVRARWLIAGSTDAKVSIWALMNFEKTST